MDILFLLVPMSVVLALLVIGVFAWALNGGQFDDIEAEGARILIDAGQVSRAGVDRVDICQVPAPGRLEQSA
jgi:cbb3-type cytochrome oxidase maturation protein